ncbi:MAG: hypothetical protein KOO60_12770 [Gemmatimonadales bacterium]|nr:hypothetical protein [Gemmatimonadales bacterium]
MIDLERLNDHSRQFSNRLFRLWPEWVKYARFDPYEDFEKEALLLEVPRPCDGSRNGLFITTSEWEISVGFGENFHTRFGVSGEPGSVDFYEDALLFLQDFLDEQIVVATAYQDKEWLGAWKIDLRQESLDEVDIEDGVTLKIRSWMGTHDRELTA